MNELIRARTRDVTLFKPEQTHQKLAQLDGDIVKWRKLKDWPALYAAAEAKVAEIVAFVDNWDRCVGINHGGARSKNALRHSWSVADAVAAWGIAQPTVSRWRTALKNVERYRARIILGACRGAWLEPAENHRAQGTGENEWFTPPDLIERIRGVMGGIDLDPASHPAAQKIIRADQFFTRQDDGLSKQWHGRVWLNPPYSQPLIGQFLEKLLEEWSSGRVTEATVLTHNYTDTLWWQLTCALATGIICLRGRVQFIHPQGLPCAPTQGQILFYFGPHLLQFPPAFPPPAPGEPPLAQVLRHA